MVGDLYADGKVTIEPEETGRGFKIGFESTEANIIIERFFSACLMMHVYCYGSGFNPKHYVEALLAEFDLPINYKDIQRAYKKDIAGGVKLERKRTDP